MELLPHPYSALCTPSLRAGGRASGEAACVLMAEVSGVLVHFSSFSMLKKGGGGVLGLGPAQVAAEAPPFTNL